MGFLSLLGRITVDGSPMRATLESLEKTTSRFSNKLRNQVGGIFAGFLGVNAVKAMALEAIKTGNEISKLATKFRLTTDEVQLLQRESNRTGESFESMVSDAAKLEDTLSRLRGGDVVFSAKAVEQLKNAHEIIQTLKDSVGQRVAELIGGQTFDELTPRQKSFLEEEAIRTRQRIADAKEAAEVWMKMQDNILETEDIREKIADMALTKEERLNKLLEERTKLFEKRASDPNEPVGVAKNELATAKLDLAIAAIRKDIADDRKETVKAAQFSPISGGSLQSVGNFLGARTDGVISNKLDKLAHELRMIREKIPNFEGGSFP